LTAVVAVLGAWTQSPQPVDEVRALARSGTEAALVARSREAPDAVRDALRGLLVSAASASDSSEAYLEQARRMARAYAAAWRDSFLVRQVALFTSWSPPQRRLKVSADSLRLAGNQALGRLGVAAAMRAWRESLERCERLGDSTGMGAALGNIGAGFYGSGELDSAEAYFAQARVLAEGIGDHRTLGNAVGALANVSRDKGDLRGASQLYAQAAEIRPRSGDTRGVAADRNNLGLIAQRLGDWAGARRAFEDALAQNRRYGRGEAAALNLVNLGNVASGEGEYAEAAARYREALGIYRDLENRVGAASVLHNLGLLALRRGDYRGAAAALSDALRIYDVTGPDAEVIAVRRGLADLKAAMGDLPGALGELRRAERLAAGRGSGPAALAGLALARADLAVQFNSLAEADLQYGRAEQLFRRAADPAGRGEAQQGRGMLLLMRERYPAAQAALEVALRVQEAVGDPRPAALTRLLLGEAQRERGDTASARRTLTQALDTLRSLGDVVGEAVALSALGDLESQGAMFLAAEAFYQRGLGRLGARPVPNVAWRLHAGLGRALRGRGALAEAARELGAAVDEIERVSGSLPLEERRADYLADKWEVYAQLALVERARGRSEAAFEVSERLRARQVLDLLARGRVTPTREGTDTLAGREQDLRRRISDLTRQIEGSGPSDPQLRGLTAPVSGGALEALAGAQEAYANLLRELREARPEYATLVRGEIAAAREVTGRLSADEALLEYLVTDSATVVFVATSDSIAAIDLDITHDDLVTLVDFARGTLTRPDRSAARHNWRTGLRRLFQELVAPVEASGLLAGKRRLLIAPHAELHYLPFAALVRQGAADQFLVERYTVAYVPSASVWLRLAERRAVRSGGGVLALAPRAGTLPGSRAEVAAIGRIYGDRARVLVGPAASERAFRDDAAGREIVHLATYGLLNKHNPLFSFVELAPQGAEDGRLEVHEVFGLGLSARLVVLSACQTALGSGSLADLPAGDDWVGLVRAFLFAGASKVLATLWPVEDRATASLMERFYTALEAGRSEAEAIALAQRSLLRNSATAHPFYWAGFALVGGQ
jgi:CHAT domain-containing protein/Tfp pilus assembly protein PilF